MTMKALTCNNCGLDYRSEADYLRQGSRFRMDAVGNLSFECQCKSPLQLSKGSFEWEFNANMMRKKTATLFRQLTVLKDIPLIPSEASQVLSLINKEDADLKDIEHALKKMPTVFLKSIEIANNLKPIASPPITSFTHAAAYIGRDVLRDIVLSATLRQFKFRTTSFSSDEFWLESTAAGFTAEFLAQKLAPELERDRVYLAASLCNIGKLVAAICFPTETDLVHRLTNDPKNPVNWHGAEVKGKAHNHCMLGEIAGTLWGFPDYVMMAIMTHHTPSNSMRAEIVDSYFTDEEVDEEVPILEVNDIACLANQYVHWILSQPHRMDDALFADYLKNCGLNKAAGDKMGEDATSYVRLRLDYKP